jgi:hypothetical protein
MVRAVRKLKNCEGTWALAKEENGSETSFRRTQKSFSENAVKLRLVGLQFAVLWGSTVSIVKS